MEPEDETLEFLPMFSDLWVNWVNATDDEQEKVKRARVANDGMQAEPDFITQH